MNKRTVKSALSLLLAVVLVVGMAACSPRTPEESSQDSVSQVTPSSKPEVPPEDLYELPDFPDFTAQVAEWKEVNEEVVGWLKIPNTDIDEYVLCREDPNDYNKYYERKDVYLNYRLGGVYYADCRLTFDGTSDGLAHNTTVYGHALDMDEDPDGDMFGQLKRFWDIEFARKTPYIYFSLAEEDLVWEIFAAFYTTTDHDYINPLEGYSRDEVQAFLDEAKARSEYNYNVEVTPDDNYLTLSTCIYKLSPGQYPNKYRWVIMAKLVDDGIYHEGGADLEENPNILNPDSPYEG